MDRSGRRTAVVAWAITVGVMFGGAATSAAPAVADDRGLDSSTAGSGSADADPPHRAPSRTDARTTSPPPGVRGPGRPVAATTSPVDPCPWPWFPPPSPPPARNSSGGFIVGVPSMPSVPPVSTFGDQRLVAGGLLDGDFGLPPQEPAVSPAPTGPAAASPVRTAAPPALVAPPPAYPPATVAAIAGPPISTAQAPRLTGPAVARLPAPELAEPPAFLPDLRPDDLGRLATTALPGLAALVGMTFLGGVIGYRQARAGYLLRAAGAGRFLQ